MENLGEFLRHKRLGERMSIEELASRTKISIQYIQAIEDNQFDQLPNPVSAKGFLKSYARCLGLSESEILETFSAISPSLKAPPEVETKWGITSYLQWKKADHLPFPVSVVVLSAIAIVLFLTINVINTTTSFLKQPPPREEVSPSKIEGSENAPSKLPAPMPEETTRHPVLNLPTPATISPPPEGIPVKNFVLLMEAMEPSWVKVIIDGSETKEALLQAHEKVRWEANEKFLVTVGNAGGVNVTLNGQDMGPMGPKGKVLHDVPYPR